jgi:uncharacterized membrane protein YczE
MVVNGEPLSARRLGTYFLGIFTVSLGIVLCKQSGLGISPISSVPLVLSEVTPLSFGSLISVFHFANTAAQMVLLRRFRDPMLWLQVPLAFVFGRTVDWINAFLRVNSALLGWQLLAMALSVFFTALGMVLMLDQNLIQNPPDGTVRQLSVRKGTELGRVKVYYDGACVLVSALLGLVFLHRLEGFGLATIVSALFVGRAVLWIRKAQQLAASGSHGGLVGHHSTLPG